jgi:hypothetical protein
VLVLYTRGGLPDAIAQVVTARRPELDPREVVPEGIGGLRRQIERFIAVGASKFVVVPVGDPPYWDAELDDLAAEVKSLEN